MIVEVKIPSPGESISEVEIASWMVEDGDIVETDQEIAEIESDKATLTLVAQASGAIKILAPAGESIGVGQVACSIDTDKAGEAPPAATAPIEEDPVVAEAPTQQAAVVAPVAEKAAETTSKTKAEHDKVKVSPLAHKLMEENNLSIDDVLNGLRRISTKDIEAVASLPHTSASAGSSPAPATAPADREQKKEKMSGLRKKLSQRLVAVKNETAMLTTFNEVDMTNVMALRKQYQKQFMEKYGFKLGFMSFFTKAVTEALRMHPMVNSQIDGDEIVSFNYADVGIAVQTPKGLMVPVVRDADKMTIAEIEGKIKELAEKARSRKISVEELTGGTFTITNGGTFGSLMSTPILNPPQSGILGMHNIVERPVAVNGKVEIRPMMYTALSYDHRIIDGKDSVGFLVKLKQLIEDPQRLLFAGSTAEEKLLGL